MHEAARVFAVLDREVWLLTAAAGRQRGGLIATSVTPASLAPDLPRVLVGLGKQHHTWELVEASGSFALHLLAEANLPWLWTFGLHSGRSQDKLSEVRYGVAETGSPILEGVPGWLDCRVEERFDTGDRTVYLGAVVAAHSKDGKPLTLKRVLELAPPERLQELRQSLDRDRELEAEAIRAWRARRAGVDHERGQ